MFEDEEWNINEDDFNTDDIFNDNTNKTENILTTKSVETKKQSSVPLKTSGLQFHASGSLQNSVTFQPNESVSISQKNIVLDIFKGNSHSQQVPKINEQNSLIIDNEKPLECTSNVSKEQGKNLILNVFQDNVEKSKPVVKSVLKVSDPENKFKRKKNVAFADSSDESNLSKKVCAEKTNKSQESRKNDTYINEENQNLPFETSGSSRGDINNSRKRTLVDLQKSSVHKSFKVPRVKQAVVRQFPGPAGILPDDIDENDVIDIDSLDENKNNNTNQYADICSQNTKNLFSTGAWQLMMDDLPADFELHDIATIKENALQYSKTYEKVPYLAGIVQCIDYRPNDPHIILKDLTGKVDAHIHHSICKLYPDALGTSLVILAKDVGVILTTKKFVCLIISLNSLVSVYSDEKRLVGTPHLKTLVKHDNTNQNMNESQISALDEIECHNNNEASQTHSREIENRLQEQSESKDKCNVDKEKDEETNSKEIPDLNVIGKDMHEFNLDEDDSWLGVDNDELRSFKPHNFPSSTPLDSNEQNSSKGHFQIKQSKHVESNELQSTSESEKIESSSKLSNSTSKKKTISERLSVFRNPNDTSRSSTILKQSGSTETILPPISKPFEPEDNDTDDEMLSQLDVDAIAASYPTQNC